MEESLNKVYLYLITYGFDLVAAVLIFFVGKWAAKTASRLIEGMLIKTHVDATLAKFVKHLAYGTAMVFIIIAALSKVGVQTTSLVAVVGAAGLAVGLALQGSLSNFAAGVILILFKPFKGGDSIEAAGVSGSVDEIQIFNTVINASDNRKVIIPNAKITGDNITNFSDIDRRLIDLKFFISYKDDTRKVRDVLLKLVNADPRVLKSPASSVAVLELRETSVSMALRAWVRPGDYGSVLLDLTEKSKIALEENGVAIGVPKEVHLYEKKA